MKHSEMESEFEDGEEEQRRPYFFTLLMNGLCCSGLVMVIVGAVWLSYEIMIATDPALLFAEIKNCPVMNVTHEFISDVETCLDRFTIEFSPKAGSSLVLAQTKEINRTNSSLCSVPELVDASDAEIQAGETRTCLLLDPDANPFGGLYIPVLNCAQPSPPCYSIVDITTTHNSQPGLLASTAFCVGGFFLMAFLFM